MLLLHLQAAEQEAGLALLYCLTLLGLIMLVGMLWQRRGDKKMERAVERHFEQMNSSLRQLQRKTN